MHQTAWYLISSLAVLLLCTGASGAEQVRQRLQKGDAFRVVVNAGQVTRPADHRVMGVSFFQQWNYMPIYDRDSGEWILSDESTEAIRSLRLPFSRLYWMDQGRPGRPWCLMRRPISQESVWT